MPETQHSPNHLARPVESLADVIALPDRDRIQLAAWLADCDRPVSFPPAARRRRRLVLASSVLATAVLIPWIWVLSVTLPNHYQSGGWRLAWVGFDLALLAALAATTWFGLRTRQVTTTALLVTSVLLLCDVWFDVTLSWGSSEQWLSLGSSLLIELPFALLLLTTYFRLTKAIMSHLWRTEGNAGPPPPMRQLRLLVAPRVDGLARWP